MSEPSDPWIGRLLDGRYRITGLIGKGGMGRVYEAEHLALSRRVAVKLLDPADMPASADPRRFAREAFAAGRLGHPNCVTVTDFGSLDDGTLFLAMERLEGRSLEELLRAEGRLPVARALHIMRHVLRGLEHAHALGIVHRDLTPRNIFVIEQLGDRDFAKLLDFGLAKLHGGAAEVEGRGKLTETGIVCGTPRYIAPEQALGEEVDHRADLYSASAILFEMITGRPPFVADDLRALLLLHIGATIPRMYESAPGVEVPVDVEMLVRRGLAKRPTHRPACAGEYATAVDALVGQLRAAELNVTMSVDSDEIIILNKPLPATSSPSPLTPPPPLTPSAARPQAARSRGARSRLWMIGSAFAVLAIVGIVLAVGSDPAASAPAQPVAAAPRSAAGPTSAPDPAAARRAAAAAEARARGDEYAARPFPTRAVDSYRQAWELDAAQADAAMIDELIDMLTSRSAGPAAARLLADIGAPALPRLQEAARNHPRAAIRALAARQLARASAH
jgi:serine/threonine-protein kinase